MPEPWKTQWAGMKHSAQSLARSGAAGLGAITVTIISVIVLPALGDVLRLKCDNMRESTLFFVVSQHGAKGEGALLYCYDQ